MTKRLQIDFKAIGLRCGCAIAALSLRYRCAIAAQTSYCVLSQDGGDGKIPKSTILEPE
jgi:hypothetical protein